MGIRLGRTYNPAHISVGKRIIYDRGEVMSVNVHLYLRTFADYLKLICAITLVDIW